MTQPPAIPAAMDRIGQALVREIKRALVIPPEPSPLPAPDDPLYALNRQLHQLIARQRGRPCACGCGDE